VGNCALAVGAPHAQTSPALRGQCVELCAKLFFHMAGNKNKTFSRRLPDVLTNELMFVLSKKTSYEFKPLFEIVHDNLRRRNAAHGGEEMLRFRAYEKLHDLVSSGVVNKKGKLFTGNSAASNAIAANVPEAAGSLF
jgi:hypothetical protein